MFIIAVDVFKGIDIDGYRIMLLLTGYGFGNWKNKYEE